MHINGLNLWALIPALIALFTLWPYLATVKSSFAFIDEMEERLRVGASSCLIAGVLMTFITLLHGLDLTDPGKQIKFLVQPSIAGVACSLMITLVLGWHLPRFRTKLGTPADQQREAQTQQLVEAVNRVLSPAVEQLTSQIPQLVSQTQESSRIVATLGERLIGLERIAIDVRPLLEKMSSNADQQNKLLGRVDTSTTQLALACEKLEFLLGKLPADLKRIEDATIGHLAKAMEDLSGNIERSVKSLLAEMKREINTAVSSAAASGTDAAHAALKATITDLDKGLRDAGAEMKTAAGNILKASESIDQVTEREKQLSALLNNVNQALRATEGAIGTLRHLLENPPQKLGEAIGSQVAGPLVSLAGLLTQQNLKLSQAREEVLKAAGQR